MQNNTILCLVDDDNIHQFIVKKLVERLNNPKKKLLLFSNGKEAINYIKSTSKKTEELPDLILLDINMPIMDGWEFLEEFIVMTPDLKKEIIIYILSSSENPVDMEKAKKYNTVSGYLIKPINETQLKSLLESV